ncbi:MAG: cytochrome P460 family protein [Deltaproteobacteria bacterium]|nr:cytochrome P460 family protein [Deltaproteobacteria bacterium]MBW2172155.1 cytochrome P460 family protein [Deltaproteobacteria bacterium]MBW2259479.1 cytochrome P460 family protein [Deltaproteobacteria bacterium]
MKNSATIAGVVAIVACFAAGPLAFADMPGPDAAVLWHYMTEDSPYKEWGFWPDHQGMQPGRAPHGPLHKVYVNEKALNSREPPVQYGAIQVKESYNKAKELKAITVMYKVNGYSPENGDWFWAEYSPDGKVKSSGKPRGCIGCHGVRAKNDFITVHEFK